ncbi:SpoIIE family protein phosphatase [Patescibacteria group bacterium]|nr:SpoIIE family protein phosphatase [Patescibacteria group bacterium]
MLRSVKSQIVLGTSLIIIAILTASTYFIIDQKTSEISLDIFRTAVSYAELTHERVIDNYESNYVQQAFAHFDREMADIYGLNEDVSGISIFNYLGEILYRPKDEAFDKLSQDDMDRIQAVMPSVKTEKDRIVYLDKADGEILYANFNGRPVEPISASERIVDIVYPFRDANNALRSFSVRYRVNYDSLVDRVQETRNNMIIIAAFGIIIALFIGGIIAGKITSPIKILSQGAAQIGSGDLTTRITVKSKSEIGRLADTFNQMAQNLEKSTQDLVEKEKMTRELELAGQIQKELLPTILPDIQNLDIAASLVSAEEVGGDCYDFLMLPDGNMIFYIGDVTGHGVPAGLVSAVNNALVPAFMDHYQTTQELIVHLNRLLKMKTRPNVFMTMVMAHWYIAEGKLGFTQAGHDPILHYKSADKSITELSTGGMALGMIDDISKVVKTDEVVLETGDVAVLYTDGIPEAWKTDTENYGMDRFKESVVRNSVLSTTQAIHDAIIKDVREFMGDFPQADDITLIVVKRTV